MEQDVSMWAVQTTDQECFFFLLSPVRVYHTVGVTYWIFVGHFFVLAHLRKCILLCNSKPLQNKKKITEHKNSGNSICTALFFRMSYLYSVCHSKILCSVFLVRFFGDFHFFVLIFNFSFLFYSFLLFPVIFCSDKPNDAFHYDFFLSLKKKLSIYLQIVCIIVYIIATVAKAYCSKCICGACKRSKIYLNS